MIHRCRFPITLLLLSFLCLNVKAQNDSVLRNGVCRVDSFRIKLDTLSIVPSSFQIVGATGSQFLLDPISSVLYVIDTTLKGATLSYSYDVFGYDYSRPRSHKTTTLIEHVRRPAATSYVLPSTMPTLQDESFLGTGSVSRGVMVGNNQDMVLNSSLNLQLSGQLSEDVEIMATISDKNIPIQPDGNTQMLSDINNIFITLLYRDKLKVDAGDVQTSFSNSDFLKVTRDMLGMQLQTRFVSKDSLVSQNTVGGGVAKGKFRRQTVDVQNGVQGPYKLYGEQQEMGIVIVAGSERVYVDGKLLQRGQENDYTVDYNMAELTFTPNMLVTSEKRIVVEFEYSDRHYTRYDLFTYNDFFVGEKKRLKLSLDFFQEQDLKNQSIQPELTDPQMLFLSAIGDDGRSAFFETADTSSWRQDRILYRRLDTLVDGRLYENVYVYSIDSTATLYKVDFSYVGAGNGDYMLSQNTTNGRVFVWIPPENGRSQGDYNPVLLLTPPQLAQMLSLSAAYRWNPKSYVGSEFVLSNHDANTFSKRDDKDNLGFAVRVNAAHEQRLRTKTGDISGWTLKSWLNWQFVQKNFHELEPFRDVEFRRDFNLPSVDSARRSEQILHFLMAFSNPNVSENTYDLNWLSRVGELQALRQALVLRQRLGRFDFGTETALLINRDSCQNSRFVKSSNHFSVNLWKLKLGVKDLMEHNVFKDAVLDTLRSNSYAFNEFLAFVQNADSLNFKMDVSYKNRTEFVPSFDSLRRAITIHEANAAFLWDKIRNQKFSARATYRNQSFLGDNILSNDAEQYYVGKIEYNGRFFHNALSINTYYEAGSGMELKKTFAYLKVSQGQGTHVWIDYNQNGVEEIDEFELAIYQDEACYVKVWLPGNSYYSTYNNIYSQSVQLRPGAVWMKCKGVKGFLARFTDVATLRSQLKNLLPQFNPFYANLEDTNLVNRDFSLTNTLSFNNRQSKFAFDFVVQKIENKAFLYYGFEYGSKDVQHLTLKSMATRNVYLQAEYRHERSASNSDYMIQRNYQLENHALSFCTQFQFSNTYVASLNYLFSNQENKIGSQMVMKHELQGLFNYRSVRWGTLSASLRYAFAQGDAGENGSVAYVMLGGLSLGHNVLWSSSYQVSLTDYLQLSFLYEGRKSEGHKTIHTASVSVKAQF